MKAWREANKEKLKDRSKSYYEANKEKLKAVAKSWYEANTEKRKAYQKAYREANKDKFNAYRESNKEKQKKWREANKYKLRAASKAWKESNREKRRDYFKSYTKKNKLSMSTRILISNSFRRSLNGIYKKGKKTEELLGCSMDFFILHLESLMKPGMTLQNHGQWHIDHIFPLSSAKTEEEIYKLNHYTNLQPLWAEENLSKGNKL